MFMALCPDVCYIVKVLPGVITSLCLDTVSARMGIGNLLLPAQLPGTHWVMIYVIRCIALTVSDACLKLSSLQTTNSTLDRSIDFLIDWLIDRSIWLIDWLTAEQVIDWWQQYHILSTVHRGGHVAWWHGVWVKEIVLISRPVWDQVPGIHYCRPLMHVLIFIHLRVTRWILIEWIKQILRKITHHKYYNCSECDSRQMSAVIWRWW